MNAGIFVGERALIEKWKIKVADVISSTSLKLGDWSSAIPVFGGRIGQHSEHLQPMLDEMSEVFRIDPAADW